MITDEQITAYAKQEADSYVQWLHAGNSTGELSEHAREALQGHFAHAVRHALQIVLTPSAGEAEPVAWIIPGDDNARSDGSIDAMAWREGEFTVPLYPSPSASEAQVRVKALEWSANWSIIKAETAIGHYFIEDNREGGFSVRLEDYWRTWASSIDTGKAAAQADYEHRIRSALTIPQQGETAPSPETHSRVLKPVPYDHNITQQSVKASSGNVDDADPRTVLLAVLGCAETWVGDARIIGNVRAVDIAIAIRAALATTEGQP